MSKAFGKYTPYNTIIHRVDARIKFFALIAFMVLCFLNYGNYTNRFIILGVLGIVIAIIMLLSKTSILQFFKSMKSMLFMFVFLAIVFMFIPTQNDTSTFHVMFRFSDTYAIYWEGLFQTLHIMFRFALMIALTLIFTATTAPMDITYALEWYFTPLRLLHFPTQILTMILSLALRFIPTLLEETQKIMKAQRSRGVDFNRGFISKKIKSITTLIIPLLVSCFARSADLSLAMDARGYDPYSKRTSYKVLRFKLVDLFSLVFILVVLGAFITMCVFTSFRDGWDNLLKLFFGIEAF